MIAKQDQSDIRFFSSYIREYQAVEKDLLYRKESDHIFRDFHRAQSSLYMIVKTKRLTFVPESFSVVENYCVQGEILVGKRRERIIFNAAKLMFLQYGVAVTEDFDGWEAWANTVMASWRFDFAPTASGSEKYRYMSRVNLDISTANQLALDCALVYSINKGNLNGGFKVTPMQLTHTFDLDVLAPLEILYIGKSTDSVLGRVRNHNKWGEITNETNSDDILMIYFMDIAHSSSQETTSGPFVWASMIDDPLLDKESITLITEAALIKHFFDYEKYNKKIVHQNFEQVAAVKNKLAQRGYTGVYVELNLDGIFGCVGTEKTGFHSEHVAYYPLNQI